MSTYHTVTKLGESEGRAKRSWHRFLSLSSIALVFLVAEARAQTTAFTFQGRLNDNGSPVNGSYDMQLTLFDTAGTGTGTQIGSPVSSSAVPVTNGVFTVQLDFGAGAFTGADRFLEVAVKPSGSADPATTLSPRQPITPVPYALYSANAATATSATSATNATNATNAVNATNATTATNSTQLNGVAASQYVQTGDSRLADARTPTAGSANYIQNTTSAQTASFNISGNGVVGGRLGIGISAPTSQLHLVGGGIYVAGGTVGIAVDAETASGGEGLYAECLTAGNNCYAVEGYAPTGDYAAYFYGGKGVYAESDDVAHTGLEAHSYGASSYAVFGESAAFRAGYFKSDVNSSYTLYVDDKDGPTQGTAALNVHGTIRGEGDLVISGSKAGYVVDIMQNVDNNDLEPGDVVVIVGNASPVLGEIPVVTIRKATTAYDTAVAGVVDAVWYAPTPETKAAYETQEDALRTAMQARTEARANFRASSIQAASAEKVSGGKVKMAEPALPVSSITDEAGTLHSLAGVATAGSGAYLSVVTLGAYKIVKADASSGAIRPGDLLTTSSNPGYAMKVTDKVAAIGAIVGKSLGNLDNGTGTIPIMVMPR